MKSIDKYLVQAMDSYPYDLQEAIESLDYALSYDENSTMALCLYARMYAEQLYKYEEAKEYFQKAITVDINAIEVYPYYIQTLLQNEDFDEAGKLIDFALTIKGINKVEVLMKKVLLFEMQMQFKEALSYLDDVKLSAISNEFTFLIEEAENRIKQKQKIVKSKEKNKKKKSN